MEIEYLNLIRDDDTIPLFPGSDFVVRVALHQEGGGLFSGVDFSLTSAAPFTITSRSAATFLDTLKSDSELGQGVDLGAVSVDPGGLVLAPGDYPLASIGIHLPASTPMGTYRLALSGDNIVHGPPEFREFQPAIHSSLTYTVQLPEPALGWFVVLIIIWWFAGRSHH